MQLEIKRIGLVGAGSFCGGIAGVTTLAIAFVLLVVGGLRGQMDLLTGFLGEDSQLNPTGEASVAAGLSVILASAAALGAVVVGFVVGLFFAAFYNVTAGFTGGLVVEMKPLPER